VIKPRESTFKKEEKRKRNDPIPVGGLENFLLIK
jgi:hypothetical protein